MSATTIKLEGELLKDIQKVKPHAQSISSYVREVLEHNIKQARMNEAAHQYQAFLKGDMEEVNDLNEWEAAPLEKQPRSRSK